jgi:glycerophosphoryl diester phosphodiesterase
MLIVPSLALPKDVAHGSSPSSLLHVIKPRNPQDLREFFRHAGESMHLVSAHRGGPQQKFPENCIATFENTLQHTFAIIEIDPCYTKDGAIVVHHDATLERTTTGKGCVAELTLKELKELRLKDAEGLVTEFQIPTLDDALQWARGKTILVLDRKDVPVEVRVRKIEEHRAEAYAMLIVYSFKDAQKCYELNKNIMMEVMIPNRERFYEFDETGIPWSNIIAFVGHTPPRDKELLQMIHAKGTCCMVGTSRNFDREFIINRASGAALVEQHYRALLQGGAM